jgi:hypothetical protein
MSSDKEPPSYPGWHRVAGAEYIGAWGHPANSRKRQMMALFTKQ